MAITFEQVIAGAPPTGGDTGLEFATKINNNFNNLQGSVLSDTTSDLYNGVSTVDDAFKKILQPVYTIETITTSQTWTVPDGIGLIDILLIGGGGAGGATTCVDTQAWSPAGGQGGAGFARYLQNFKVTPGSTYSIVVGSAGLAATTANTSSGSGNPGGNTSFGDIIAYGGGGGGYSTRLSAGTTQGANGAGSSTPGSTVYNSSFVTNINPMTGTAFVATNATLPASATKGNDATGYGGAGSGAGAVSAAVSVSYLGGNGYAGVVYIKYMKKGA